MAQWAYSYRLKREVWLLNDVEFAGVSDCLGGLLHSIMEYRKEFSVGLDEARNKSKAAQQALTLYETLTGSRFEEVHELYHVKLSHYGRLCPSCGKPFRTPRAKLCAECGYHLPEGEVAGPLIET